MLECSSVVCNIAYHVKVFIFEHITPVAILFSETRIPSKMLVLEIRFVNFILCSTGSSVGTLE
jgi:hypothetical protein